MSIGRPRIRQLEPPGEMSVLRRHGGPQAEGAVHVHPSSLLAGAGADFSSGIKRPGVHIASLNTEDCPVAELWQPVRTHSALIVGLHAHKTLLPKASKAQRLEERGVYLFPDYDFDGRRSKHPVISDVPPCASQQSTPCRHDCCEISGSGAGH